MKPKQKYHHIGSSSIRPDAKEKLTGKTKFLTDIHDEDFLYAAPVYSSIPFGKILSIDTSKSEIVKGYIDFISAKDIPGENQIGVIFQDQPLFADEIVRYIGDCIGLIIATTHEAALFAAKKVSIEYESYSPVLSIDDSKNTTDHFIHETNVACNHRVRKGDIDIGFRNADHIIEATFKTPFQEHYYLEPQGCIVRLMEGGKIFITGTLQCPFYIQKAVARVLNLELSDVIVEQAPTGGGFGGKEDVPSELAARVAVAVRKLQKPIKMVYSRKDDMQLTSKRHPFQMNYKVGVKSDGTLTAAEVLLEENAGAYATLSTVVSYRAAAQAMGPYRIPHVKVDSFSYYTNLPPTGAFRGFGSPQAAFGHERMMDVIAAQLKLDPAELRLKNIVQLNDFTITDQKLPVSVGAKETLMKTLEASKWYDDQSSHDERYLYGKGISTIHYGNCLGAAGWHMDGSAAKIHIHENGQVDVAYGLVEMGQGSLTVVRQMTAEALGVSPSRINVLPTSTLHVPDSGPAVASRNVVMTGNAIKNAAGKLKPILLKAASELLECDENDIVIRLDQIRRRGTKITLQFEELVQYLYQTNRQTEVMGWWHVRELDYDAETGIGEAYFTYSYATHLAEVKIDKLTGLVHVDKIYTAHDIGKAINPAGLEGQIEGGTAQGIGWALTENFKTNEGSVITDNLSTYLLPTANDVADEVHSIIVEDPEPEGPWGAKGIGEPAIIPTGGAIANAVSQALQVQINELPITPEIVLHQLTKSKNT